MDYLYPETLGLIMYILFEGDLIEEAPYEFATKVFGSDMNYIFDELEKNKIDDCFEIGLSNIYYSRFGKPIECNGVTLSHYNRPEVEEFLNKYIDEFEEGKLQSPQNYYSFENQMAIIINSIFEPYYNKSGKNFSIDYNFEDANFTCAKEILQKDLSPNEFKNEVQKNFRLYEALLYFNKRGYIKINKGFKCIELKKSSKPTKEKKYVLSINITLEKTPVEIRPIFKRNLSYGDLKIDLSNGNAWYQNNKYHFDKDSKTFQLLSNLVKNPEKEFLLIDMYKSIYINAPSIAEYEKKERMTYLVKDIREKLKMSKSKNSTIEINIKNGSIKLISKLPE